MDNTGFYQSSFAVIMFLSFTLPILVYFFNCWMNWLAYFKVSKANSVKAKPSYAIQESQPVVINLNLKMPPQPKWRNKPVRLNKPVRNKKNPKRSHVYVKNNENKVVRVNFTTPKPVDNSLQNKNIVKESVNALKTLGYKSGEVKKTLEDLCISTKFNNSESLIDAFFKSR